MPLKQVVEGLKSSRSAVDTTYGIVVSSCRCRVVVVAVVGAVVVAAATITNAVSYTLRCFARLRLFCTESQAAVDTFVALTVSFNFNSSVSHAGPQCRVSVTALRVNTNYWDGDATRTKARTGRMGVRSCVQDRSDALITPWLNRRR